MEQNLPPRVRGAEIDWQLFGIMMAAAVFASLAIVPYLVEIFRATGKEVALWELLASTLAEHLFLMGVAVCVGLLLCPRVDRARVDLNGVGSGWGTPLLSHWLAGKTGLIRRAKSPLLAALIAGIGAAVFVSLAATWFAALKPEWPDSARQAEQVAENMVTWKPLLASFSAGITEEILFRYGLMTLLIWLAAKLAGSHPPGAAIFWMANVLAALLFSLAHLTNAVELGIAITAGLVLYVIMCNGLASLVFGWLYWRHGLEAAVVAHITADVVLKVVIPLFHA